jgi:hypothetical protein
MSRLQLAWALLVSLLNESSLRLIVRLVMEKEPSLNAAFCVLEVCELACHELIIGLVSSEGKRLVTLIPLLRRLRR